MNGYLIPDDITPFSKRKYGGTVNTDINGRPWWQAEAMEVAARCVGIKNIKVVGIFLKKKTGITMNQKGWWLCL